VTTITITVPTEYLPAVYKTVADLMSKGVNNHFQAKPKDKKPAKDRWRNKAGLGNKGMIKAAKNVVSDLRELSKLSSDGNVKSRMNAVIEKILDDTSSEISGNVKCDAYITELGVKKTTEEAIFDTAKKLPVIERGIKVAERIQKESREHHDKQKALPNAQKTTYGSGLLKAAKERVSTRPKPQFGITSSQNAYPRKAMSYEAEKPSLLHRHQECYHENLESYRYDVTRIEDEFAQGYRKKVKCSDCRQWVFQDR